MQPKEFLIRLNVCHGLGVMSKYRLWRVAAERYEFENLVQLLEIAGINHANRHRFLKYWNLSETERAYQRNRQMPLITLMDPGYPEMLKQTDCPPLVLYFMGDPALLNTKCLAVVGARQMSNYARSSLLSLLPPVIKRQVTVVSGLARGVDGLSHEITLKKAGKTIAVIGNGLNRTYPREHTHLQRLIKRHGLVISEYPLDEPSLPHHFVERNRIIAGLSQACLVVEARQQSGSLITVNLALKENRNVLAVPGPINSSLSQGCNELIAAGARPILTANDILEELNNRFFEIAD